METTTDLTTMLPLTDGALSFGPDTVPGLHLADVFAQLTNGLPLRVHDATRTVEDGTVRVSGSVDLASLPTLPIALEVKSGDEGPELKTTFGLHELSAGGALRLNTLWQQLRLPTVSALPIDQLAIDGLELAATKRSFALTASMAAAPGWTLNLGPAGLAVSDVRLTVAKPGEGRLSSRVGGKVTVADKVELALDYDTAGPFGLRAALPSVRLSQLVRKLTGQELPGSFDPTLDQGVVLIQGERETLQFQVAANFAKQGQAMVMAKRTAGAWGFAAGVDLGSVRLGQVNGLEVLDKFQDIFQLQHLLVVVSSYEDRNFAFPSSAAFADPNNPAPQAGTLQLPNVGGGLVRGLNVYATWKLDPNNSQQRLLAGLLRISGDLAVILQLGANPAANSSLAVSYATTIKGMPFLCQFGGQLSNGEVALFLRGQLQANIQGTNVTFDAALAFAPNGAFIAGSMQGTVMFYLDSSRSSYLSLSNLALVIGINPEGIPSLGVAGTVTFDTFQLSLAMFFDSSNPAQSMLAGAVSNLKLADIVKNFARTSVPPELGNVLSQIELTGTSTVTIRSNVAALVAALDARQADPVLAALTAAQVPVRSSAQQALLMVGRPGATWFLTDTAASPMQHYQLTKQDDGSLTVMLNPQFYCAPQDVNLGALAYKKGFFLTGRLKLFAFDASVKVLVSPSQGVAIDGTLGRIVIGTEALFALEDDLNPSQGPVLSVATFTQPGLADPGLRGPHFLISGSLTMLGIKRGLYVRASDQGLLFDINGPLSPLVPVISADLHGHFRSPIDMGLTGSLTIGIPPLNLGNKLGVNLGNINIGTNVTASLDLGVKDMAVSSQFNPYQAGSMPGQIPNGMPPGYTPGMPGVPGGMFPGMPGYRPPIMPSNMPGGMPGTMPPGIPPGYMPGGMPPNIQGGLPPGYTPNGYMPSGMPPSGSNGSQVRMWATVQVGAQVAGQFLNLPPLSLEVTNPNAKALLNLPQKVADLLIGEITRDANRWAKLVQQGLITGVQDVGKALKDAYQLSNEQAQNALRQAGYAADQVDKFVTSAYGTVAKGAQQTVNTVFTGTVGVANTVGNGVKDTANTVAKGATGAANTVGSGVKDAANTVGNVAKETVQKADPRHW